MRRIARDGFQVQLALGRVPLDPVKDDPVIFPADPHHLAGDAFFQLAHSLGFVRIAVYGHFRFSPHQRGRRVDLDGTGGFQSAGAVRKEKRSEQKQNGEQQPGPAFHHKITPF